MCDTENTMQPTNIQTLVRLEICVTQRTMQTTNIQTLVRLEICVMPLASYINYPI
ncbi:predicted protein [Nematostella vectensis]|uniref:Uncharacterized protein n=1 Tax=Nematostella vectensis TaxID=45351 RepID=A7T3G0_NEMVE|nr:predicted protein [Nematostella vectensis]|eukprot:XP_001621606.1 hypothetical protein NEMVEDRAFT_v1g144299 [Nematostella vectensis]